MSKKPSRRLAEINEIAEDMTDAERQLSRSPSPATSTHTA